MSFLNNNLTGKPSLVKPAAILIATLLVIGGVYTYFSNKSEDKPAVAQETGDPIMDAQVKSSGIDSDKSVENVADVEEVVAKWIEANPEAIIKSVSSMQQKQMEARMKDAQKNISLKKDELLSKKSPQYAPSGYDVTVVEFFDYNCGYCKKAQATVEELLKEDKKVRIIYKEFPILGQPSLEMSQVAIAVNMVDPSSYKKFHDTLMKSGEKGKQGALNAAKAAGINMSKLEATLQKDKAKIDETIQGNLALGSSVGISGTPGFVIGEELLPGALELAALKEKVAAARK